MRSLQWETIELNGWIESGVRTVEAQIRALKMGAESRYGIVLDHTHSLITWIVDYAGWLVTRYGIGRDGKSPYRILRGRDATSSLCEFAECNLGNLEHRELEANYRAC